MKRLLLVLWIQVANGSLQLAQMKLLHIKEMAAQNRANKVIQFY